MVNIFLNFWLSFLGGLSAPLVAVCVLPLYPGFLSLLAFRINKKESKKTFLLIGLIVTLGILISMFVFGLIFTLILHESLTNAISIISPIAFMILAFVSILLIINFDFSFFPKINVPIKNNPLLTAFIFGIFFGAIILPCNPASLVLLFAISTSTLNFIYNLINFISFGLGMSTPLLLFTILSAQKSSSVINWLSKNKKTINFITGIVMLLISLYYLFLVFRIHELII